MIETNDNIGFYGMISCSNVTIKNLTLSNNIQGILIVNTTDYLIENCEIENNYYGIYSQYSNNNQIKNNNVSNNEHGIYLSYSDTNNLIFNNNIYPYNGYGISISHSTNITIKNNIVSNNYGGIKLSNSNNNLIKNNNFNLNSNVGITFYSSNNNTVMENLMHQGSSGIFCRSSSYNYFINNNISENDRGISFILTSNNNQILNNSIYDNNYGIYLHPSCNNIIINNSIFNSNGFALDLKESTTTIFNSTIINSEFYDFYLYSYSKIETINTNFNKNLVWFIDKNSELIVNWSLYVRVLDKNNQPIHNAKVRIQDNKNGTYDKTYTSDLNGFVKWVNLTEYIENKNRKYYYTPHNITAEKDRAKNSTEIRMNQSREIIITLDTKNYDWIVTGPETRSNETIILNGNLTIESGGNLTFNNVTLIMNCSYEGQYHIEVKDNGKFYIYDNDNDNTTKNDASNITSYNKNKVYNFYIRNNAALIMKNSLLSNCGFWEIDNTEDLGVYINSNNVLFHQNNFSNNYGALCINISNPIISNNTFWNNSCAIYCKSGNGTIENNTISVSNYGIYCDNFSSPKIMDNNIFYNTRGIYCFDNSNPEIESNHIFENLIGIHSTNNCKPTITYNDLLNNNAGIKCSENSEAIIKSNKICFNKNKGINCENNSKGTIESNNISNNQEGIYCNSSSLNIIDNIISNNVYGITCWYNESVLLNNTIFENNYSIYLKNSNLFISNSSILDSIEHDFYLEENSHLTTLNTTFNKNKVYIEDNDSDLTVKWFLNIKIINKEGSAIQKVKIHIFNDNCTFNENYTTDSNGLIEWIECYEYMQDYLSKKYYTPHTINASKDILYNETKVFINESKTLTMTLEFELEVLEVIITKPKNGELIMDNLTITVEIKNVINLEFIAFYIDGTELQNSTLTLYKWNTKYYENKEFIINVTAKDKNYFVWDEIKVTVNNEINNPPVITTTNIENADILEPYSVQYEFTDQDVTDIHTWQLITNTTWLNITENGNLYGTPTQNDIGSYWVNITVTDNGTPPLFDYTNFTLIVVDNVKIPKIEITNILFDSPVFEEQNITIEAKIKNKGNISISNFTVTFYYDNKKIESLKYEKTLEPNIEISINISWQAIIGNHTIEIEIKTSEGELLDSKESTKKLEVKKVAIVEPKIEITKIRFQKQALEGQNITINATIKNIGTIPISNFSVIFYYGDKIIDSKIFEDNLDVGEETTIEIKWIAVLGNHTIKVEVKLGEKVLDIKESTEKLEVIKEFTNDEKEDDKEKFPILVILLPLIFFIILIIAAIKMKKSKKNGEDNELEIRKIM